jgi:hypothetical protein
LVDVVPLVVKDHCNPEEVHELTLEVALNLASICMPNYYLNYVLYFTLLHQLFIVGVHLLEEIDAANVVGQMALSNFKNILQLFLIFDVVPHEDSEEVVGSMECTHGQIILSG